MKSILTILILAIAFSTLSAQSLNKKAIKKADAIEQKIIDWRRHFHQNPELSNREFKTAERIADHLNALGLEVRTGIAHTGVIGALRGNKPGPVIALRADIDALPVTERNDLPFKSNVKSTFNGMETGVMHACGHDTHIAMLMGVAEVLTSMKKDLKGTVVFIFQPAEEGSPEGEEGGAGLMVKEGALENPDVDVIFGLHISAKTPVGHILYKPEGLMAASDRFEVTVTGRQAHGSAPWNSIDPIAISTQMINSLQYIISRNSELTKEAAVITVGMIKSGIRFNIIPESAYFEGTIRTLDKDMQTMIHDKVRKTIYNIADISGAKVDLKITSPAPLTYNDPQLMQQVLPSLIKTAGDDKVHLVKAVTGAEDFSFFQMKVPGVYFFIGGRPEVTPSGSPFGDHHTPDFYIDESGMMTGVHAFLNITLDYMEKNSR